MDFIILPYFEKILIINHHPLCMGISHHNAWHLIAAQLAVSDDLMALNTPE
jgi:hypothetical protein